MGVLTTPKLLLDMLVRSFGYKLAPVKPADTQLPPFDAEHQAIIDRVQPFTMTSPERIAATCQAVDHVIRYGILGDFVECGVWRGGSTMAAALSYLRAGSLLPNLYLFDTFEGMSEPTKADRQVTSGETAAALLASSDKRSNIWAYAPIDEVRQNVATTGYPTNHLVFVKGRVEETIPTASPEKIAVLRLDTDWYESTRHELEHLFPRLSVGGVLIIDDYGHWTGARKAVDEYFNSHRAPMLLARSDYTGRIGMKTG
jgi:hypothetical protein